jgi:hypothetical protein
MLERGEGVVPACIIGVGGKCAFPPFPTVSHPESQRLLRVIRD